MTDASGKRCPIPDEAIGFVGLGVMGQPMALNMVNAGIKLICWNRTLDRTEVLREAGAKIATSVDQVFERARIVIVMLFNEAALDAVLQRGYPEFSQLVAGKVIVSMGSNSPEYSRALSSEVMAAGGRYVEAPVSGSRKPAESGQLVSMIGGEQKLVEEISPLLKPMCKTIIYCGDVGNALLMKLAVNLYLNTMLVGLAEAIHFADQVGLDLAKFSEAIGSGPMACDVTRVKIPKLIERDFSVQAATSDAYNSTRLIADAARNARIVSPLLDLSSMLYKEAADLGNGNLDMVSVIRAIEARSLMNGIKL